MPIKSPAYKNHLRNLQNEADAKKLHEIQKLDLYNEQTFYKAFVKDMLEVKKEIIIYSPFITKFRSEFFKKTFEQLKRRNIAVFIFTRPLDEQEYLMRTEIKCALKDYEELGAYITYLPGFIHAKVAIIDREILWEGSLNILSQRESKEIMRRIADEDSAKQVMSYLGLNKELAEGYKFQYERLYRNLIESSKRNWFSVILKIILERIKKVINYSIAIIRQYIYKNFR
jgi:phosphatidylserine/phosphatidylglycerophosphate/cardiolipin synthase-like enzyme